MAKTDAPIVYRFTGAVRPDGRVREWHEGIPARDLTQADVDRLEPGLLATLKASPIYAAGKAPTPSTMSRDELDAYARTHGVADPEALPNKEAVLEAIRAAVAAQNPTNDENGEDNGGGEGGESNDEAGGDASAETGEE